ncbi:MAG: hypothetical protein JF616_02960 [Fibrobacteres bacterium]|nr:hypothetical protein [Fibrobacterota bacterium]
MNGSNFIAILLASAAISGAALNVPLEVHNWAAVARSGEPVTAGIPLPAGAVTDLSKLRIVDAAGKNVPAQFKALSRWWYEKNDLGSANPSAKWVLCDFQANAGSQAVAAYSLKDDAPSAATSGIKVTDAADGVTVETGPLKFIVSKKRSGPFESLWLDSDGNGQFSDAEQIIAPDAANAAVITAADWAAGGATEDQEHSSATKAPERVVIEEQGPVKVVIRVEGRHYAASGGATKGLYGYRAFITAYAGLPFVDVQWALTNTYLEGTEPGTGSTPYVAYVWPFKQYRLDLNLKLGASQTYTLLGETESQGTAGATAATLHQGSSAYTVTGGAGGTAAKGAGALSDGSVTVMAAVRDFAPNAPQGISISKGKLSLELFAASGASQSLDPMSLKSHRFRLAFTKGAAAAGALTDFWKGVDAPLKLLAPREWYRATLAWDGGFGIPPDASWNRMAPSAWQRLAKPAATTWLTWGELEEQNGGGDHENLTSCFWKYLLTGNPKEYELWESRAQYYTEVMPIQSGYNRWDDLKFMAAPEDHLSAPGISNMDTPENNYSIKITAYPGYARNRDNLPDSGHMINMEGLEYYLLTGDPGVRDGVESAAIRAVCYVFFRAYGYYGYWPYRDHKGTKLDVNTVAIFSYGPRYIARPGVVAMHGYEITGDDRYLYPAKIAAYSNRNLARLNPIGYIAKANDKLYMGNIETVWKAAHLGVATPAFFSGSDFQIGIAVRCLRNYWEATHDENISDAVIFAGKSFEWRSGLVAGKYTGFSYDGWADYLSDGKRYTDVGLAGSFTSSASEGFQGLINGYLASGRKDLLKVVNDGKLVYASTYTYGSAVEMKLINLWEADWRSRELDTVPPAKVTDLAVTQEGDRLVLRWTAPGGDGGSGKAAKYQVKYGLSPIVDFPKRWDATTKTGWPDLNDPLPATDTALLLKAKAYQEKQEVSFWGAENTTGEPAPQSVGAKETFKPINIPGNADYYFAMVSYDDVGNVSDISNVAFIKAGQLAVHKPAGKHAGYAFARPGAVADGAGFSLRLRVPEGAGASPLSLRFYGIRGALIKVLQVGSLAPGARSVYWDGRDGEGRRIGGQKFVCRLVSGTDVEDSIVLTRP